MPISVSYVRRAKWTGRSSLAGRVFRSGISLEVVTQHSREYSLSRHFRM